MEFICSSVKMSEWDGSKRPKHSRKTQQVWNQKDKPSIEAVCVCVYMCLYIVCAYCVSIHMMNMRMCSVCVFFNPWKVSTLESNKPDGMQVTL